MIPDEKQKLELKVRLKYKVNEKFQEIVGTNNPERRNNPIAQLIAKEAGPAIDQINQLLELDPDEITLFLKYREGHKGQKPIENRFYDYFQANLTTSTYTPKAREPAGTNPHPQQNLAPLAESANHG